jgi:hypothetical protein
LPGTLPGPQRARLNWGRSSSALGQWNDIAIFNNYLAHFLDLKEHVEADSGYRRHDDKVKCPNNPSNHPENLAMQARVRSRHETFNGILKNWSILANTFRHNISLHSSVLHACAVITQLMVENGEPLFSVEYSDSA